MDLLYVHKSIIHVVRSCCSCICISCCSHSHFPPPFCFFLCYPLVVRVSFLPSFIFSLGAYIASKLAYFSFLRLIFFCIINAPAFCGGRVLILLKHKVLLPLSTSYKKYISGHITSFEHYYRIIFLI